jgi:hypothetical protein
MIKLDLIWAIALFISFALMLVFIFWIIYNFFESTRKSQPLITDDLQQCPYCMTLFFDYQKREVIICPHCKSYVARQDLKTKNKKEEANDS